MGNIINKRKKYSKVDDDHQKSRPVFILTLYDDGIAYVMFDSEAKKHYEYERDVFINDSIHGGCGYPNDIKSYKYTNESKIQELINYLNKNKK